MKTLDEVIKANECCDHGEPDSRCEDCPYNGLGACCQERESDALHYLKHLQEYYEMSREHHEPNPPLTWDELKTILGKPVWVEYLKDGESYDAEWIIIQDINDECMSDTQRFGYQKLDYSDYWQAYRKERK